ncbi:MAG: Anti-sigma-28 factor, FlgM [Syntrophus sp. PtaB.Bin075]|nr:MAG: Anti-sigma-28 factor, FlgM [Syntrophus sp. PtaB.Bin075]
MNINNTKGISAKQIQQYEKNESLMKGKMTQDNRSAISMPQEKVELSDAVKEIQQIKNTVDNIPDIREDKVTALKNQIDNSTYNVNAEEVAEKMVAEFFLDILG